MADLLIILIMLSLVLVTGVVAFTVGRSGQKPVQRSTVVLPKVFGLKEFEKLVDAIPGPAKADPDKVDLVVQANTALVVGFLGFEDRVVQEAEETITKNQVALRQNSERIAGLQEEISQIQASISEFQKNSTHVEARIGELSYLKSLKTS